MESRGPEDSKNVKTSQAYFFEGFISFFEDFSLTMRAMREKQTCIDSGRWGCRELMTLTECIRET